MDADAVESRARAIVLAFKKYGWDSNPYDPAMELALASAAGALGIARTVLHELHDSPNFHHAVLAFVADADWPRLVEEALGILERDPSNEAAAETIWQGALQRPSFFHPHLSRLFPFAATRSSYDAEFPWREAGPEAVEFLYLKLNRKRLKENEADVVRRALLATRRPEAMTRALEAGATEPSLLQVGFEKRDRGFRQLYPERVLHVVFPKSYLPPDDARPLWRRRMHPTWTAPGEGPDFRIGGVDDGTCGACRGRLHHLLTLDPVPEGLGVTGMDALRLGTCLSCLGWERTPFFYRHSAHGYARSLAEEPQQVEPKFTAHPLKEGFVRLANTGPRWRWQEWGISNNRENLHRVGGFPSWVQSAEHPECPGCFAKMTFLLQLDSDLPDDQGGEFMWGSGGLAYGFWCDPCRISAWLWQCT
jgi:hypothetical protein